MKLRTLLAMLFATFLLAGCQMELTTDAETEEEQEESEVVDDGSTEETADGGEDLDNATGIFTALNEDCGPHLHPGAPGTPDQILCRDAFAVGMNHTTKLADWVAYYITAESVSGFTEREENFREDEEVPEEYRATLSDYSGSGYDRGHMAPSATVDYSYQAMDESFLLSNITPQLPNFNRTGWADLEAWVRGCAIERGELHVITGTYYDDTPQHIGNFVEVPDVFYKVILDPATGETTAFLVPHQDIYAADLPNYVTMVDAIESLLNVDFFANVEATIQAESESTERVLCELDGYPL